MSDFEHNPFDDMWEAALAITVVVLLVGGILLL